jgi:hypothetical protein
VVAVDLAAAVVTLERALQGCQHDADAAPRFHHPILSLQRSGNIMAAYRGGHSGEAVANVV